MRWQALAQAAHLHLLARCLMHQLGRYTVLLCAIHFCCVAPWCCLQEAAGLALLLHQLPHLLLQLLQRRLHRKKENRQLSDSSSAACTAGKRGRGQIAGQLGRLLHSRATVETLAASRSQALQMLQLHTTSAPKCSFLQLLQQGHPSPAGSPCSRPSHSQHSAAGTRQARLVLGGARQAVHGVQLLVLPSQ